jgi:PIN domain nuclease of toxin-antitoxin system
LAVLLDTHAFLWWCEDSPELSPKARKAIAGNDCFVSMASFWEIAIKLSLKKLRLPAAVERYLPQQMSTNGFKTLEIGFRHTTGTVTLPWHHRDPFDRLLAAQALEEKLDIVSRNAIFDTYGLKRTW